MAAVRRFCKLDLQLLLKNQSGISQRWYSGLCAAKRLHSDTIQNYETSRRLLGHFAKQQPNSLLMKGSPQHLTQHVRTMFIQTQDTPNPNALKFLPGCQVLESGTFDFPNPQSAHCSPLAKMLFRIDSVRGIFLTSDSITVTKWDDDTDWAVMKPEIFAVIMDFFAANLPVLTNQKPSGDTGLGDPSLKNTGKNGTSIVVPPNFSWCESGLLAACAFPSTPGHLYYLVQHNVGCLISLTDERHVERGDVTEKQLQIVNIPVVDYTPPTLQQVDVFLQFVEQTHVMDKAVCVHCAIGRGRTGTMLACFYAQKGLSPELAIDYVRQLRPGSLETAEQEMTVHEFSRRSKRN